MVLDRQITAQATVLSFSKIYLLSGTIFVCALPCASTVVVSVMLVSALSSTSE